MKNKKQFEKWALKELHKLSKILLLEDFYPIELEFNKDKRQSECSFSYPYKSITIYYSQEVFENWKKGDKVLVMNTLTHEMCHPITDPLISKAYDRWASRQEVEDERERLTDHIANIILKLK